MISDKRVVTVTPARPDDRALLRELAGTPLLSYTLWASQGCPFIDAAYLLTGDAATAELGEMCGAEVLGGIGTGAGAEQILLEVLGVLAKRHEAFAEIIVLLEPRFPFCTKRSLSTGLEMFADLGLSTLIAGRRIKNPVWRVDKVRADRAVEPAADGPFAYEQARVFTVVRVEDLLREGKIPCGTVGVYEVSGHEDFEIRSDRDFAAAGKILPDYPDLIPSSEELLDKTMLRKSRTLAREEVARGQAAPEPPAAIRKATLPAPPPLTVEDANTVGNVREPTALPDEKFADDGTRDEKIGKASVASAEAPLSEAPACVGNEPSAPADPVDAAAHKTAPDDLSQMAERSVTSSKPVASGRPGVASVSSGQHQSGGKAPGIKGHAKHRKISARSGASGSPVIFIAVPTGSHARNLLMNTFLDRLLEATDARVVIFSGAYDRPEFITEFARDDRVIFEPLVGYERTFGEKLCRGLGKRLPLVNSVGAVNRFWHGRVEAFLKTGEAYREFFDRYRPRLVITPTPGYDPLDLPMLRQARKMKVRTLTAVNSWDNLQTKGPIPSPPDYLALWNEMMVDEASALHHYPRNRCYIVGVPHYDEYRDPSIFTDRATFCKKAGLDPARKIVAFTTAPASSLSDHTFILELLLKGRENGKLGADVQILTRFHPAEDWSVYDKYRGATGVVFETPGRFLDPIGYFPSRGDLHHLANTVRHADVVVNMASTITIEAAMLDTPIVNLGFSLSEPERFRQNIIRDHWDRHYRHILECDAIYMAESAEDLFRYVNRALENPEDKRDNRRRLAERLTFSTDGRSSERLKDCVCDLLAAR